MRAARARSLFFYTLICMAITCLLADQRKQKKLKGVQSAKKDKAHTSHENVSKEGKLINIYKFCARAYKNF